ncbi:hypothetical protein D1007_05076 [Hordeum vulgare]|nr:hypothetical protein D1007_05076 [Hordeum vulgare]
MVPADKKGKAMATTGPTLMPSRVSKAEDLVLVLLFMAGNMHEWGATTFWPGSAAPSSLIWDLHLKPNSIFLLVVFAFYCEAFSAMRPSVVLVRHFFSLQSIAQGQRSACISFVEVGGAGTHLKAGKMVKGY